MPSPGSVCSVIHGTALKEQRWGPVDQVGHIEKDEGRFDNGNKAPNQRNVHLTEMMPALLSAEFLSETGAGSSLYPVPAQGDTSNLSSWTARESSWAGH